MCSTLFKLKHAYWYPAPVGQLGMMAVFQWPSASLGVRCFGNSRRCRGSGGSGSTSLLCAAVEPLTIAELVRRPVSDGKDAPLLLFHRACVCVLQVA